MGVPLFWVRQSKRQQKGIRDMDRQQIFDHVKQRYGTVPDHPWADQNAVLRHKENKKWYGLIMEVGRDKLGLPGDGQVDILNVKCDPVLIGSLRAQEGFHPAYHMNKEQWISIRLDGSAPAETVKSLLDLSFAATKGAAKGVRDGSAKGAGKEGRKISRLKT